MAGKRRADGKPTRRVNRVHRRMERLNQALAATTDPRERVVIAADHYRSALAAHHDQASAERVVTFLVEAGNRLFIQSIGADKYVDAE
ncbi:hypothetical protein [Actinomadura decatromicini]|uniref:Uncharacterized protein n=1 Tax=Actinomadura decatromicini TaxID=2604572 RepID=A0A5D3F9X3_9ACTN|nr:hypothetical protein [Actinomadura decatromicini]TYK45121.1 hypothetical protein FXF68_31045 [Actinomadura decatromicini]